MNRSRERLEREEIKVQQINRDKVADEGKKMLEIIILNDNYCLAKSDHAELGFVTSFAFYSIPQGNLTAQSQSNNRDNS